MEFETLPGKGFTGVPRSNSLVFEAMVAFGTDRLDFDHGEGSRLYLP
jgi:hypothetical protein